MSGQQSDAQWLRAERQRLGWSAATLAEQAVQAAARIGVDDLVLSQQSVSFFENGNAKTRPRWFRYAKAAVEAAERGEIEAPVDAEARLKATLLRDASPEQLAAVVGYIRGDEKAIDASAAAAQRLDLVGIASVDQDYGMGLTFADNPVAVEVMHFPRAWIEALTATPASLLTWARGRGDSMSPTINDNDLVLIDRSERRVEHQDVIWAFTIGDTAMMKRLRVRGEKVTILSDAAHVPPDEAHPDEINIVGRVAYVLKRT